MKLINWIKKKMKRKKMMILIPYQPKITHTLQIWSQKLIIRSLMRDP